jgi:D-glycero-alpha-D-manno-heptose-7-phosphate kinase
MDRTESPRALRIINSVAPIRICDNGGWTDTWFARHGKIFNIAVYPYAEVQMRVIPSISARTRITIHAENYGQRYTIDKPEKGAGRTGEGGYTKHPLLEAALEYMHIPDHLALEISIYSEAPAGGSTGTSAAVSVALIGALDRLTPGVMTAHEVARTAHKIETEVLRQQCGIQDQLASAYGGINFIEMEEYPRAVISPIQVPNSIWWELERRLALVFLGQSHNSSETHRMVIRGLENAGPEAPQLTPLRQTAGRSRDALFAGDFAGLGQAMIDNTEAQRALHPDLVSTAHQAIIDTARAHGALGWKVNGAGGDGGSVTILAGADMPRKRAMLQAIEALNTRFQNIPIYLSRAGLRVWEAPAE